MHISHKTVMWILILVQAIFGLLVINGFPISLDEPYSIYHAQSEIPELLAEVNSGNNAPLHFLLLHFWVKLFGISAFAVRSLSLIIALFSTAILFQLARKFFSIKYSILLVGLFIFSRLNHFVALEARMYGLFTLFFMLILWSLWGFFIENKKNWFWLAIWNVGLMYTHYLGGVVIFMEVLLLIFFWSKMNPAKWKMLLGTFGLSLLLFAPGIYLLIEKTLSYGSEGSWVPAVQWSDLWTNLVKLFNNQLTLIVTLVAVSGAIYLFKTSQEKVKKERLFFLVFWSIGGYFLLFLISLFFSSVFFIKYLQFLTIPFFLLLVYVLTVGFENRSGRLNFLPFLLLFFFAGSVKFIPDVNRETDKLIEYVEKMKTVETIIYYSPPHYDLTLAYYIDPVLFKQSKSIRADLSTEDYHAIYHADEILIDKKSLIYIDFDADMLYPENEILHRLDSEMIFESVASFKGDFNVFLYRKRDV